jgi:hypothetical protein
MGIVPRPFGQIDARDTVVYNAMRAIRRVRRLFVRAPAR